MDMITEKQPEHDRSLCGAKSNPHISTPPLLWAALVLTLLLLPPAGMLLLSALPEAFFEFPPRTLYVVPAPFSPAVFLIYLGGISAFCLWWIREIARSFDLRSLPDERRGRFPVYGWAGLVLLGGGWVFAWTRFPALQSLQLHTFFPLWMGYILTAGALCQLINGRSPITAYGRRFWLLFPQSALFWWVFEYLNRFVQNWSYENVGQFSALQYFLLASLSFSTVLPAVLVTKELLECFLARRSEKPLLTTSSAWWLIAVALPALFLTGVYPQVLFPMVWVAPLCLFAGATLRRRSRFAAEFSLPVISLWALAALICGFFWEMWNFWSMARWIYHVPYVGRFHLFEMPLLGFAGYLPFGVLCGVVCLMLGLPASTSGRPEERKV